MKKAIAVIASLAAVGAIGFAGFTLNRLDQTVTAEQRLRMQIEEDLAQQAEDRDGEDEALREAIDELSADLDALDAALDDIRGTLFGADGPPADVDILADIEACVASIAARLRSTTTPPLACDAAGG